MFCLVNFHLLRKIFKFRKMTYFLLLPLHQKREGGPRVKLTPPPLSHSQNQGGMCTRGRTQRNKNESENMSQENIIDSVRRADIICFEDNCVFGSHLQACKTKAKNMLRTGDIYDKQKAFITFESDSEEEQEEEEEEQQEQEQDIGLGGSSPIPSIHHSFEEDDTLTHGNKVEDEFSQKEEEGDEQTTQDEQF
jgi:hypothetical protein